MSIDEIKKLNRAEKRREIRRFEAIRNACQTALPYTKEGGLIDTADINSAMESVISGCDIILGMLRSQAK